jgi:site-specific recombinase XerD
MYDLNVLFYLKKTKKNKAGKAPAYLRITVNGQRAELAVRRSVRPTDWDPKAQRVKGKSENVRLVNNYLDEIGNKVNRHFNTALQENKVITAEYLKNILTGKDKQKKMLISVFDEYIRFIEREKGRKYSPKTVARYSHALKHIKNFMKLEYNQEDIELQKLDVKFMRKFDIHLQTVCDYHPNTVTKYLKILKTVVHTALSFGYIDRNPFEGYFTTYKGSNRKFLSAEELSTIEMAILPTERLERVRDVFIFICYTGISYSDLVNISADNLSKGIDGRNWLNYERLKTRVRASIPLLPPAQVIIDKYKNTPECIADGKLFPVISNQKFNDFLKEIAILCKINKPISAHIGRHTFATTVTLTNGVPLETVSKMLGHSSLKTTQIYSRVVDTKISNDMQNLEEKLTATNKNQLKNAK